MCVTVLTMKNLHGKQSDRKRSMKFIAMGVEVLVEEASKNIFEQRHRNMNIPLK